MRTIRASEIGAYLYCQRAWWYQRQGFKSENQAELSAGSALHERHWRSVLGASLLRLAGYAAILLAAAFLTLYLLQKLF
jgi:hypothetical protein